MNLFLLRGLLKPGTCSQLYTWFHCFSFYGYANAGQQPSANAIDTDTLSLAFSSSLNARPPLLAVARAWGLRTRVRHMLHKYVSSTQELYFRISLGISVVTSQSICFRSGGFMMIYHDGFQTPHDADLSLNHRSRAHKSQHRNLYPLPTFYFMFCKIALGNALSSFRLFLADLSD